jgi:two-component system sensor histidine kinase TctE
VTLVVVAFLIGAWAFRDAQRNAAERFDRSLLSTALAVSRDIAITGGDALSENTRDLLSDTSGGAVFYHVFAPDGAFVTGYATPPVPPDLSEETNAYTYYDAIYFGDPIRALRFGQRSSVDGLTGLFTYTVWQSLSVRDGFVRTRTIPVFVSLASMIGALALIVWFGVRRGLAPLLSLEEAIAHRSVNDLSPIKRRIPTEVSGIVARFNSLLSDLSQSIQAKDAFISDAAHQLRNPIAGVIALTESVANAKDHKTVQSRIGDLQDAVKDVGILTNNLLTFERLKAGSTNSTGVPFDVVKLLQGLAQRMRPVIEDQGVVFNVDLPVATCVLRGDPVMVEQAVLNTLNNALAHGGPHITLVRFRATCDGSALIIVVEDDGQGIAPENFEKALGRFSQVGPSIGSGLGLAIAEAVMRNHNGSLSLQHAHGRFRVQMHMPMGTEPPSV